LARKHGERTGKIWMDRLEVTAIGTGWCGSIRAEPLARHPMMSAISAAARG
jgi:hypothetical protein